MNAKPIFAQARIALLCTGLMLATTLARGEMISTPDALATPPVQDKATIEHFVSRADVQKKLQDLGLSAVVTAQRIALLNDDEARALADKINALPAGGNFSSLSSSDIIILLLGAILLVLVL